jgi:carbamoyltransferase
VGLGGLLSAPACVVIKDGRLVAAIEQNKVSRQDRLGSFPLEAFQLALSNSAVAPADIDCVAIARPFATGSESFGHIELRTRFPSSDIVVVEHPHAHAASAYYASSFDRARVLTLDRAGDYRSAVLYDGIGNQLNPVRELYYPDSLGDLYNRVTALLGFEPRADEHKVQWLSTSGDPKYEGVFWNVLHRSGSLWPQLDSAFIDPYSTSCGGFSSSFFSALGIAGSGHLSSPQKADVAASLQRAVENTVIQMLGDTRNVCVAGGLALNALLIRALEQRFDHVFVQPVAGNTGTALGAALYAWHNFYRETTRIGFRTLCLGPSYSAPEIKQVLENCKLRFRYLLTGTDLIGNAIRALSENQIIAWMQGRMEFGPRALGNRSILASPLNSYSTENLNVYIKHREPFRKFAASVPEELAEEYFEVGPNSCWLATVGRVKPPHRDLFEPAILGGDLIRVHTVSKDQNPVFHALLKAAGESTGVPVLYNTSFNLFGDPLVCTPRDAVRSFYSSGIDTLFVGDFRLDK